MPPSIPLNTLLTIPTLNDQLPVPIDALEDAPALAVVVGGETLDLALVAGRGDVEGGGGGVEGGGEGGGGEGHEEDGEDGGEFGEHGWGGLGEWECWVGGWVLDC